MCKIAWIMTFLIMATGMVIAATHADIKDINTQIFTKHKFAAPVNTNDVRASWHTRGYGDFYERSYMKGWSRDAHTHDWDILLTLVEGQMEFVIEGKRYVVEPGDELFYPANAVISARNLYGGWSVMLSTRH